MGRKWERDDEDNLELLQIVCTLNKSGGLEFNPKFLSFSMGKQSISANWKGLPNITNVMFLPCLCFKSSYHSTHGS